MSRLAARRVRDGWTYAPTTVLLPGPGCYALRVSGAGVDDRIVFEAARAEAA